MSGTASIARLRRDSIPAATSTPANTSTRRRLRSEYSKIRWIIVRGSARSVFALNRLPEQHRFEVKGTRGHNPVSRLQPRSDLHPVVRSRSERNLARKIGSRLPLDEDHRLVAHALDRAERHHRGALLVTERPKRDPRRGEHPEPQAMPRVLDLHASIRSPRRRIERTADVGNLSAERLAGIGIHRHCGAVANRDAAKVPLVDSETDPDRAQIGDREHGLVGPDLLADGKMAADHRSREWRKQREQR